MKSVFLAVFLMLFTGTAFACKNCTRQYKVDVNKNCNERGLEKRINAALLKGHKNIVYAATEAQQMAEKSGCRVTEIEER